MKEIGGYIEFEKYDGSLLHKEAIALNCGRNCLGYLIRARKIKKILLPYFLCDSVSSICRRENVEIRYYSIDISFKPLNIELNDDEWLYIVNYYGQLDNSHIKKMSNKYHRIIVDNAQAYFQMPTKNIDTIYTCRKFFGVSDGAFLYTDAFLNQDIETDYSFDRMRFLLGRFEKTASEFYSDYTENNHMFEKEPIKTMSGLTKNLLKGVDYRNVKNLRTQNFRTLHNAFKDINKLDLKIPDGAFMYPLYIENGSDVRKKLQQKKIYIPTLWPDVFKYVSDSNLEYDMAKNILPLPCDQRYSKADMEYIITEIKNL